MPARLAASRDNRGRMVGSRFCATSTTPAHARQEEEESDEKKGTARSRFEVLLVGVCLAGRRQHLLSTMKILLQSRSGWHSLVRMPSV